ncbi:hypothetical protein [Methylocystis bryophila]|uniref:Uncharacterized protein n=1 Tax=Methylocystis bryophila TaxID=655015 RepID=A0A1W6MZT9_9HYPH|nr:hypothetical protein [Methylocystis bryophila]ARN83090.1 hypothetical protein B1812_20650 [Methylocystis bryophila]
MSIERRRSSDEKARRIKTSERIQIAKVTFAEFASDFRLRFLARFPLERNHSRERKSRQIKKLKQVT